MDSLIKLVESIKRHKVEEPTRSTIINVWIFINHKTDIPVPAMGYHENGAVLMWQRADNYLATIDVDSDDGTVVFHIEDYDGDQQQRKLK